MLFLLVYEHIYKALLPRQSRKAGRRWKLSGLNCELVENDDKVAENVNAEWLLWANKDHKPMSYLKVDWMTHPFM
jgi:hypothetical protein